MRPLIRLTTKGKAKLLFDLFRYDMDGFVSFLTSLTNETLDDQQEIQRVWGNPVIQTACWLELAGLVKARLEKHGQAICHRKKRFAKSLFDDQVALFSIYALTEYSETKACPPNLSQAIWLLFTLNNINHEIFNEFRQYRKSETIA